MIRNPCLAPAVALSAALASISPAAAQDAPVPGPEYWLGRIATLDDAGPSLDAVIVAKDAATLRRETDRARRLPLGGLPVLVKDNIETREWATTAGSLALAGNRTGRDAPLVARLRKAGAVILGKTNLSEWANIRSSRSSSGWSAVGGQTKNPHAIDRSPCGSSSGSAAAVAAGLAPAAIGTETDGSITCPASINGIVGFKPSVGLVSRSLVVPISVSQDTAGPMTTRVREAARLLTAMAGSDRADPATAAADAHRTDFEKAIEGASLKGVRIGVLTRQSGPLPGVRTLFDAALADMKRAGAELVEIEFTPDEVMGGAEFQVLLYELREGLAAYLKASPAPIPVGDLDAVIAWNEAHADAEMPWFEQDIFEAARGTGDAEAYRKARETSVRLAGAEGIDGLMAQNRVAVLVAPTAAPAWPIDLVAGDHFTETGAGSLAAIAGYPHLTVPMGAVSGLPVGLSFIAGKWADAQVLGFGAAYEAVRSAQVPRPSFRRWGEAP